MLAPARLAAQDDALARADQAYVEVNFAQALQLAQQALETGQYGPAELERIYRLIGVTAAAQGEDERAVEAYVRMFALNPDAQADENLSPRLRQPFMEALGRWSARRGRFAMELRRLRDSRGVGLSLEDPVSLAARVVVYTRIAGRDAEFAPTELAAGPSLAVPLEGLSAGDRVEVYARALDAHGNRVLELGSEVEPHVLDTEAAIASEAQAGADAPRAEAPSSSGGGLSPWFFVAGAALTAVAAGVLGWSIADVLSSHDDYLREPTLDKYYYGLDLQTRTNALIVTTSALGIASVVLAIFTEWSAPATEPATDTARARWTLFASPTSAGAAVTGEF